MSNASRLPSWARKRERGLILAVLCAAAVPGFATGAESLVLNTFDTAADKPTYTFLTWKDKLTVADGSLQFRDLPCNGGAGFAGERDLTAMATCSPALRIQTGPANTARQFRLKLIDTDGRSSMWNFELPPASDAFIDVLPAYSASLTQPDRIESVKDPEHPSPPDLARIQQYQLLGDWQKGEKLDIKIDSISLIEPTEQMNAQRAEYTKHQAALAAQQAKEAAEAKTKEGHERQNKIRAYGYRSPMSPQVKHVSLAAPDLLCLTIEAQWTMPSTITPYVAQPGDEKKPENWPEGGVKLAKLSRGGKTIGRLLGKDLNWFATYERLGGDPLLEFLAEDTANYTIKSADDLAYAAGVHPTAVYRKTVPADVVLPGGQYPTRHKLFLKLPSPIQAGKHYAIAVEKLNVQNGDLQFDADLQKVRSDAVHVNQIGYRPDDPAKRAFLSMWTGTGGAVEYPKDLKFSLIDEATNQTVFTGKVEQVLAVDGKEPLWTTPPKNYSSTAVYKMEFGDFHTPGKYRVYVNGVGCSYPFEVGENTWQHAFLTQMKGLYNQRSGVELGPPYTDFKKPVDFNPPLKITRTDYDALTMGSNSPSKKIPELDTGEPVENAWGGYHDAGDWNPRRVTHMYTTLAQLELCELYPDYFNKLDLNIPKTDGVPDMITEALFEIDCFRRLQYDNGAIPYGIETAGDPLAGEVSWLSTQRCFVIKPNVRDSWLYAAVAARAAKVLRPIKPELAKVYLDSSTKAFAWAEGEYAKMKPTLTEELKKQLWDGIDARNLASLILYDLTGDAPYHEIFKQDTVLNSPGPELVAFGTHIQCDAVFAYARMDTAKTDPTLRQRAVNDVTELADRSLAYAKQNAFNLTRREPGRPLFAGFFSTSGGTELVRAYWLLKKPEYLAGAVQSCQFQSGCNPNNLVYTSGLGSNPVQHPLNLDARSTGQPVPIGLTVFGNADYFHFRNSFWDVNLKFVNKPDSLYPDAYSWPLEEAYFDIWVLVSQNEYVIDSWAPNVLVWGCLAARPDLAAK